MITVSHEEIMRLKYADRDTVPGLERHADGACIHLGQISPSCEICFTGRLGGGIQIGQSCQFNCPECYYWRDREDHHEGTKNLDMITDFFRESLNPEWKPRSYSYQSTGETLLHIDKMMPFGPIFKKVEDRHNINIYHTLYSNGVLIDEAMLEKLMFLRIKEIRFHVSASKFSDKVFRAMELTKKTTPITVSVEEPSMPHRWDKLIEHLDTFEELGVKHFNLVEVQITEHNEPDLEKLYPGDKGRRYKEHFYHLYDEGMVYEIMRERQKRGHTYSVMDCNSMVESYRHGKCQNLGFNPQTLKGMCAPFPYKREDEDGKKSE